MRDRRDQVPRRDRGQGGQAYGTCRPPNSGRMASCGSSCAFISSAQLGTTEDLSEEMLRRSEAMLRRGLVGVTEVLGARGGVRLLELGCAACEADSVRPTV